MSTTLYFHDLVYPFKGTMPAATQSSAVPTITWAGATTTRFMSLQKGGVQQAPTAVSSASASLQTSFIRTFSSPPLLGNQTIAGNLTDGVWASAEDNAAANFFVNSCAMYVWRPSTGAKVGNLNDLIGASSTFTGPAEASAINQEQTDQVTANVALTSTNALDGDVIVFEVWASFTQGNATARNPIFYYNGNIVTTGENVVVNDLASYITFSQNIFFKKTAPSYYKNGAIIRSTSF